MYCGINLDNLEELGVINKEELKDKAITCLVKAFKGVLYNDTKKYGSVTMGELKKMVSLLTNYLDNATLDKVLCYTREDTLSIVTNELIKGLLEPFFIFDDDIDEKFVSLKEIWFDYSPIYEYDAFYDEFNLTLYALDKTCQYQYNERVDGAVMLNLLRLETADLAKALINLFGGGIVVK